MEGEKDPRGVSRYIAIAAVTLPAAVAVASFEGCALPSHPDAQKQLVFNTVRDRFDYDLTRLDNQLTTLRNDYLWKAHPKHKADPQASADLGVRLERMSESIKTAGKDAFFGKLGPQLQELGERLEKLQAVKKKFDAGEELSKDDQRDFNQARGYIKGLMKQLELYDAAMAKRTADGKPVDESPQFKANYSPVVTTVAQELPHGEVAVSQSVGDILYDLWWLKPKERQRMTIGIIENETTKVVRIDSVQEPGYTDPVLHVYVQREVDVGLKKETIVLHLRQTIERDNSFWVGLGVSSNGGLVIRNTLVDEVPINANFAISAYNTCLTYFNDPANPAQTQITFTDDMELTFYGNLGSGFMATTFRTGAKTLSAKQLERTKDQTLEKASEIIVDVVEKGGEALEKIQLPSERQAETTEETEKQ